MILAVFRLAVRTLTFWALYDLDIIVIKRLTFRRGSEVSPVMFLASCIMRGILHDATLPIRDLHEGPTFGRHPLPAEGLDNLGLN